MASHPYNQQQQQKAAPPRSSYARPTLTQAQYSVPWSPHHHGQNMGVYPPNTNGQILFNSHMSMPPVLYPQQINIPQFTPQQRPNQPYFINPSIRLMSTPYPQFPIYPTQQAPPYYYQNNQQMTPSTNVSTPCMSPQSGTQRSMNSIGAVPSGPMGPPLASQGLVQQPQPPDIRMQHRQAMPHTQHMPVSNTLRRRPKAVAIVHPETGKDVFEEMLEDSMEKKNQTSTASNGSAIVKDFIRRVSVAANEDYNVAIERNDNFNVNNSKDSVAVCIQEEVQTDRSQPNTLDDYLHTNTFEKYKENVCQLEFGTVDEIENDSLEIKQAIDNSNINDILMPIIEPRMASPMALSDVPKSFDSVPTEVSVKAKAPQPAQRSSIKNQSNRQNKHPKNKTISKSRDSIPNEVPLPNSFEHQMMQEDCKEEHSPTILNVHINLATEVDKAIEPLQITLQESTSTVSILNDNDSNNNSEAVKNVVKQVIPQALVEECVQPNVDKLATHPNQIVNEVSFVQKPVTQKPPFCSVPPFADTNKNIVVELAQTQAKPASSNEIENPIVEEVPKVQQASADMMPNFKPIVKSLESDKMINNRSNIFVPNFNNPKTNVASSNSTNYFETLKSLVIDETDRADVSDFITPPFPDVKGNSLKLDVSKPKNLFPIKPNDPSQSLSSANSREKFDVGFVPKFENDTSLQNKSVSRNDNDNAADKNAKNLENVSRSDIDVGKGTSPQVAVNMSNGVKRYNMDFMKSLQGEPGSQNEPNILHFDGVDSLLKQMKGIVPKSNELSMGKSTSQRRTITKRGSQQGKASSPGSGSMSNMKSVTHVSLSLHEDVKLNETENPWKPTRMKKAATNAAMDEDPTTVLIKDVRSILNKITPQKYAKLINKIKAMNIDTSEKLEGVIDLIWEKAVLEPNFATFYSQMCRDLKDLEIDGQRGSFGSMIVAKCQKEFLREKKTEGSEERQAALNSLNDCTDSEKRAELLAIVDEEDRKMRMRSVGNIKFIGELFITKMLLESAVLKCVDKLLKSEDEETLECLCKLLTTIGSNLDKNRDKLNVYFGKIQGIINRRDSKLNSRVKFMLQDVVELRNNMWIPRRTEAKPKTMDEIKQEADSEHLQIQFMNASSMSSRKDDKLGGGRRSTRSGSSNRNEDEWILNQSRNRINIDSQKLSNMRPTNINETKLGPPSTAWGKGSVVKFSSRSMGSSIPPSSFGSTNTFNSLNPDPDNVPYAPSKSFAKNANISKGGSVESSDVKDNYGSANLQDSRGSRSNSSSRGDDRIPVRDSTLQVPTAVSTTEPLQKPLTDQQIQATVYQVRRCMEDYFSGECALKLAMDEIKLFKPNQMLVVLEEILDVAINKSVLKLHMMTRDITSQMVESQLISTKQYFECINTKILSIAPDLLLDIPKIYQYLAVLLTPHIKDGSALALLFDGSEAVIEAHQGGAFISNIFKQLLAEFGQSFVHGVWKGSNLDFALWMPKSEVAEFVKNNNLEFLNEKFTPDQVEEEVFRLIQLNRSQTDIEKWIDQNIGEVISSTAYLRAITKAVCKDALLPPGEAPESRPRFCSKSTERLNIYSELLNKHIQKNQNRQLQCLLAIQNLINTYQHPQGVTLHLFNHLLESDVICADAFLDWEVNSDPHEQEGRGVMVMSLNSFFASIKEISSEQYDDSCDED